MKLSIHPYIEKLGDIPPFLVKYLSLPCLKRLKNVCYFCGMDYASCEIYDFSYSISRLEHSITTALLTWKVSSDAKQTIVALFHDVATPCFSHVIDYMNEDYMRQESTEEKTEEILKNEKDLPLLLKEDNLVLDDILCFKKYPIVDNERPKLCADRLDGIILTSLAWTKELNLSEIDEIIDSLALFTNEDKELEIGFTNRRVAKKIFQLNQNINLQTHSNYDAYMMMLLANITKIAISKKIVSYNELYELDEKTLFEKFTLYAKEDHHFNQLLEQFRFIKLDEIPLVSIPKLKDRVINPLVNGKRYE